MATGITTTAANDNYSKTELNICKTNTKRKRASDLRYLNDTLARVQRSAKRLVRGCEKFVPALAYLYLFCLALPGFCLARFTNLLPDLCTYMQEGLPKTYFARMKNS